MESHPAFYLTPPISQLDESDYKLVTVAIQKQREDIFDDFLTLLDAWQRLISN